MPEREIQFWLDFGSNYSYIAAMRAETLAERFRVRVQWRPFMLGPIFESLGWKSAPFVQQEVKGAYVWKDMARQCRKYGVPWSNKPSTFPRPAVYTMRVAAAFSAEPWVGEYCRRVMTLNFVENRDIHSNEVAVEVLNQPRHRTTLRCMQGRAWVTFEFDSHDYFLLCGQDMTLEAGRRVFVDGIPECSLSVQELGSPVAFPSQLAASS